MTRLCVAIFASDPAQVQRESALAAESGADLIELRIDDLPDSSAVAGLVKACALPCIVTCRPTWEGGRSTLADGDRASLLSEAADAGASLIDVEFKAVDRSVINVREMLARFPQERRPRTIVSSHDFTGRPDRLYNAVSELNTAGGDITKIVWTARTLRDNLEAFELLQHRQSPMIALCMGEAGLISRVLAKKFGAFLSFASLDSAGGTAPGQVSITDMKRLYRWDAINADTKVYGVVATPVSHSMSPALHNAAFDATGWDGVYLPLLVNAGYESFKAFMESFVPAAGLHLSGLSVTLPHKENALRYLTEKGAKIDPLAASIGAVNTIVIDRSAAGVPKLAGTSTDYAAILDSITAKLEIDRAALVNYRVAVIGAGGTGRTAVAALAHYGATVVVYNRTFEKAQSLAAEFNGKTGKVVAAKIEKLCDSCCQIYINNSSVGMRPDVDVSPFGETPPALDEKSLVFDAVYNPPETKFLRQAKALGAKSIHGVEMFVRQAAAQFEAWTNQPAPLDVMQRVVEDRLRGDS